MAEVSCSRRRRGLGTADHPIPAWSSFGPGRLLLLVWVPILLIDPILDTADRIPGWPAWLSLAAVVAMYCGAVFSAYSTWRHGSVAVIAFLAAQTAATAAIAWVYGVHWYALFMLLALAMGAVGPPRWAPAGVVALTVLAAAVAWPLGGTQVWTTALTTFLTGISTYGFHRLVAVIIELDATREALALKAVDEERLRFSRDLHDLLGHTLSVIVVKSELVRRLLPGDPEAAAEHAGDIETIGRQSLVEVREAVTGYRDADIARELDRARIALEAAGIDLRVDTTDGPVPPEVDALFGWIVREAVTNVIRHSGAANCTITQRADATRARLTVVDDGHGRTTITGAGKGIRGLSERAAAVNGRLEVTHSRRGFALSAEVPLQPRPENGNRSDSSVDGRRPGDDARRTGGAVGVGSGH